MMRSLSAPRALSSKLTFLTPRRQCLNKESVWESWLSCEASQLKRIIKHLFKFCWCEPPAVVDQFAFVIKTCPTKSTIFRKIQNIKMYLAYLCESVEFITLGLVTVYNPLQLVLWLERVISWLVKCHWTEASDWPWCLWLLGQLSHSISCVWLRRSRGCDQSGVI